MSLRREIERSLPSPTAFNIDATDLYSEWKHWSSVFETYSIAFDLPKKEDAVQRATMLHCLGPAVKRIINTRTQDNWRTQEPQRSQDRLEWVLCPETERGSRTLQIQVDSTEGRRVV